MTTLSAVAEEVFHPAHSRSPHHFSMLLRSFVASAALLSFTVAAPVAQVSQITDGQVQAPTGTPVSQISDGQVQAPTGTPVSQISDGQVQAPTGTPVSQISDGQVQAPTGTPVSQISDGQVQAPTGAPVTQISDGQVQAPTGAPVTQISDGQVQAPTGAPVTQISDGQVQAPTGAPVTQISDGQVQAPTGAPVTQISDGQVQAPTGAPVTQISDGQVQAPTGAPVTQISDGQVQAPTVAPVTQISDGQVQAPTGAPVTQISDGQVQAPTGAPVTQISDGQVQAPAGAPVTQIPDGQPQAPQPPPGAAPPAYGPVAVDQSGNVPGYINADAPYASDSPTPLTAVPTSFGLNSQISAIYTTAPTAGPGAADTLRSNINDLTQPTSHGPYSGEPTTIGAVTTVALGTAIADIGPNPTATYYNTNGLLTHPEPIPYTPYGGLGTNGTTPRYMVNSDFDYESIQLGLYQEWIELDCFNNGLATFSEEDFLAAGLTSEDRELIRFMGQQEEGHATLLSNMLGETAVPQCTYNYPYTNVREFIDFNQILTRYGESGVWGFINHLDSREVGQLLAQSIATEARQQMIFRQMSGLTPMAVWFETGIPQSWQWTFLAPYISSCPENATRLAWQNFPALHVVNQANINRVSPNDTADWERADNRTASPATLPPQDESCVNLNKTGYGCGPAIAHNRSEPLTFPGKQVRLLWDTPGQAVGPNNSYVTSTAAGAPKFVAWANQLNLTYTDLTITGVNEGYTYQPAGEVYQQGSGIVNDTAFIALTDTDMFLTPFNLSMINPHVVALGIYQAG